MAVLVAAALVGLWYSVLRPAVRSAAREAITPEVVESAARQGDADANGGGNGKGQGASGGGEGGAAGSGGASATPGGDASSAPGDGATAQPGEPGGPAVPKSARVQVQAAVGGGATRRTAYTVPKGKTFELTDIVVQNPQGDAGTLVVATDDGQLLNLALENFRDSDYHFVTPIEVPSGGRITLAVSCRQVGKPVKAPAPSQCSESLFLGGKISANAKADG
ncbi:hypothetical protein [Streptomyces nodosus]|uniref:hypothetical protein n=1 Tax=Streptomyces nodosus TaxID=40318 RepID=UPI000ACDF211|nr:hypothetical protein [Streptomyces nodosus]